MATALSCSSIASLLILLTCLLKSFSTVTEEEPIEESFVCQDDTGAKYDDENEWKWIPQDKHPCNIDRMDWVEVFQTFGPKGVPPLYPKPLVIVHNHSPAAHHRRNQRFRELTRLESILDAFPHNFSVVLSSSNSFSEHRRTVTLQGYLEEILQEQETTPDQRSNETWYLFGETYSDDWKKLLRFYELPFCQTCTPDLVALSFGIGNRGSGVQWHVHGPGFSEAIHGRKHWVLLPPDRPPTYHKDQTSRNWMEYTYTTLSPKERPWECTLEPGDLVYFPNEWYHATINLGTGDNDPYTAFVSTFTTEHNVELDEEWVS